MLNTILEHNSNDLPWRKVQGYSLIRFSSIDNEGFIDMKELELLLSAYNEKSQHGAKRIKLVAVSGASNVLGVFNNLKEISKIIHRYGARLLVDGAQMIAHRKVSMVTSGIDYLTLSAHKVYAPFGTGLLITKKGLLKIGADELKQIQLSGEENIGGIATMGKAFVILQRIGIDLIQEEEQKLTRQALRGLMQIPGIKIHGLKDPDSPRLSDKGGVLSFEIKKTPHDKIAKELAHRGGIGVRFGCHCAHLLIKHLIKITPTLENVQRIILSIAPKIQLPGVVRISMGISTTEDDIDRVINMLSEIAIKPKAGVNISKTIDTFAKDIAEKVYS